MTYSIVVDNVSERNMSQEVETDVSVANSSQEVEVNEVNSDEEVEQNDDVFCSTTSTPVTSLKSSNSKAPRYVGAFWNF